MMNYNRNLENFKKMLSSAEYYNYVINTVMQWDKLISMPAGALEYRTDTMGFMADRMYQICSSKKFDDYVQYFDDNEKNDYIVNAMIKNIKQNIEAINLIPKDEYDAYIKLITESEQVWQQAKKDDDFQLLEPYLQKIFDTFKKFAEYWGYEDEPYDALLNYYVQDWSCKKLDSLAIPLRDELMKIMKSVKTIEEGEKRFGGLCLAGKEDADEQIKLWKSILEEIGFDFNKGRIDVGPYTTILANNPTDVRIINACDEDDVSIGISNLLHSGGKGIYQQNIDMALLGTMLADPPSCAIKEAIGRFYENIIGKSKGFCNLIFPKLKGVLKQNINVDDFYSYINRISISPIRLKADEMTYLMHILIRYELERLIINGEITIREASYLWNEKYEEYLGVKVKSHREGILQDVHWSSGYVGYFPTYILANFMSAQLAKAMEADIGNLDEVIENQGIKPINHWLSRKVYRWGSLYNSYDLINKACGEEINSEHYIAYLKEKFIRT